MYGTIADWRTWATARGDSAPSDASDGDATAALVRASDYIRDRYVANLLPRYDLILQPEGYDYPLVEEATYVAAGIELGTAGFFSTTYTPAEQKVLIQVQNIRWQVTGDARGPYGMVPVSTRIDAMFEPYTYDRKAPFSTLMAVGRSPCL
ncbi:hypothetical protein [Amorphus sp. MBR-141]